MVVVDAILLLLEIDNWSVEIGNIRTWKEAYWRIQIGDVLVVLLSGIRDFLLLCENIFEVKRSEPKTKVRAPFLLLCGPCFMLHQSCLYHLSDVLGACVAIHVGLFVKFRESFLQEVKEPWRVVDMLVSLSHSRSLLFNSLILLI
jgi:hypothetical protein